MDPDIETSPARTEARGDKVYSGATLTSLIVLGVVLQVLAGIFVALAWPETTRTHGDTGSAAVVVLAFGVIGLAGILVLIGAVGWGVLIALRIRDVGRGE